MDGSLGSDHRGVVCGSPGPAGQGWGRSAPRGGWAGNLALSSDAPPPPHPVGCPSLAPASHAFPLTEEGRPLPRARGPHAASAPPPLGPQRSQREGNIWKAGGLGQSRSWRAGGGGVGGAKGPAGGGGVGPGCTAALQLVGAQGGPSQARSRDRRGWAGRGGPKCREAPGWVGAQGGGVTSSKCGPGSFCFPLPRDKYL